MLIRRPKLPTEAKLLGVVPGERPEGEAGAYAPRDGSVSVQIEANADQLFNIDALQIWDLEPATDLPPGHTGPPPMELVPGPSVAGPGPIEADAGEAVMAMINFLAPVPVSHFKIFFSLQQMGFFFTTSDDLLHNVNMETISSYADEVAVRTR